MRQARRGSMDACKTDDEITPPPSRQAAAEARPGSPLRLSSISFSGNARDQQDPGLAPMNILQALPEASPFAEAFAQAGQAPWQGEGPRGSSRGGSRGGSRGSGQAHSLMFPGSGARLGSPLRTQSPHVPEGDEWGTRTAPPSREAHRYDSVAVAGDSFGARNAPPSRESARGGSRRGSRTATPPAPVTAWDGAWTLPAVNTLGLRSSLDGPTWAQQLPPMDVALPPSRGRTPPLGSVGPSTSSRPAVSSPDARPCLPGHLPPLSSPSKARETSSTSNASPPPSSKRHPSPNVLGISQPMDVANASLAAIRAGASLSHLTTTRAHVQIGMKELAAMDSLVLGGATLDRKQFGEAVRQIAGKGRGVNLEAVPCLKRESAAAKQADGA